MLDVTFEPSEHVLTIGCISQSPGAALNVVETLTTTSEKYMRSYQQNISLTLMEQLQTKRLEVVTELKAKEQDLLQKRRECGDITVGEGKDQSHPIVQRVNQVNEDFPDCQVTKENVVLLVQMVWSAYKVFQELVAKKDLLVSMERKVKKKV